MKRILAFCIVLVVIAGCDKDKFKTEPQVEIESLGPENVVKGQTFSFRATIRDKEGDLQDSVYLALKRYNGNTWLTTDTIGFSLLGFGFPDRQEIELNAVFLYGEFRAGTIYTNLESADRNFAVGIIARDKAGNRSPYVESDKIVLKKL